jgi:hypothetical protein
MFKLLKDTFIKFWADADYAAARLRALWFLGCQAASIALANGMLGANHPKWAAAAQLLSSLSLGISQGEKNPKPPTT